VTPFRRAAIVAVGSELLTPSKLDTNSLYITEQLNRLGIDVTVKSVVGDSRDELAHAIRALLARVDLLILCGGLGPTDDDVTREAVAAALERPLSEDAAITGRLRERFKARGFAMPMPEINRRQAMVPAGAVVIENTRGSAPGLWIDLGAQSVVLLPGPPRELKPMLAGLVDGRLSERGPGETLVRRVVRIAGRIESQVDEVLQPLYYEWVAASPPIAATILATLGSIELHLSARASSPVVADAALDAAVRQVAEAIGGDVYSTDGRMLEQVVGDLLVERGLRIAAAESCTGGLITSRLTDVPGSSRYVDQSVITYSNDAKTELLGVPPDMIKVHGAVSEPVALAMADGVRSRARADVGIAGPTGGTPEKPVGMVVVAAVTSDERRCRTFRFYGERELVKFQASQAALDMVRRLLAASGESRDASLRRDRDESIR
jgi:nicotinamide-nucleotide amidase